MRSPWTAKEKQDYIEWHEKRMHELQYPEAVLEEFRASRKKFLDKIRTKPEVESEQENGHIQKSSTGSPHT